MNKFFILGSPRSGTTLFRVLLNSHPEISVPPECGFLTWWYEKYKDWVKNDKRLDEFINDFQSSKKIETWNLNFEDLRELIYELNPTTYEELTEIIYHYYAIINKKENVKALGDKNNYYISNPDLLKEIYPPAKYIHIVRDSRDVACSYKELNSKKSDIKYYPNLPESIEEIANLWNNNINKVKAFLEKNVESITIRYEDLIKKQELILDKICYFIGVKYSDIMINTYTQDTSEPISFKEWKGNVKKDIFNQSVCRYKNDLSSSEIEICESICKINLKIYNYINL